MKTNKLSEADYPYEGASGVVAPNVVIVFYVGGTTYEEGHCVTEWNKEGSMNVVLVCILVLYFVLFMRAVFSLCDV